MYGSNQESIQYMLLGMLTRQIESGFGFETLFFEQEDDVFKTVNLIKANAMLFIEITRSLKHKMFFNLDIVKTVCFLLEFLIRALESQTTTEIKVQFSKWDLLLD